MLLPFYMTRDKYPAGKGILFMISYIPYGITLIK